MDLSNWVGPARPERKVFDGSYCRLEPLDAGRHAASLYEAAAAPGAEERFRYLGELPPQDFNNFKTWVEGASNSADPLFFAVIDRKTGRAEGRQALMRIDAANGVIEIGSIMWGPAIARTQVATEALFLLADYVFAAGYRRFEWKCNDLNLPSKRAAERFGFQFEGIFRQHMVVKGENRDTAWFAMIDGDWPRLKRGYQAWLRAENFDSDGRQNNKLTF